MTNNPQVAMTAEKYWSLSYYPWLDVEPDLPPPQRLAQPRSYSELPDENNPALWYRDARPPVWSSCGAGMVNP